MLVVLDDCHVCLLSAPSLRSVTDVRELHDWHTSRLEEHPLFHRLSEDSVRADPAVSLVLEQTEEGRKVARLGGRKYLAVYERLPNEQLRFLRMDVLWKETTASSDCSAADTPYDSSTGPLMSSSA
jgi:Putative methyltransferase